MDISPLPDWGWNQNTEEGKTKWVTGKQNGSHWIDNPESSGLSVIWIHTLPYWLSQSELGFNYSQKHPLSGWSQSSCSWPLYNTASQAEQGGRAQGQPLPSVKSQKAPKSCLNPVFRSRLAMSAQQGSLSPFFPVAQLLLWVESEDVNPLEHYIIWKACLANGTAILTPELLRSSLLSSTLNVHMEHQGFLYRLRVCRAISKKGTILMKNLSKLCSNPTAFLNGVHFT